MSLNGKVHVEPVQSRLVQVQTHSELVQFWPYVLRGLERIKHRDKTARETDHHQIFNAIRFGLPTAQPRTTGVELYLAMEGNRVEGFMITAPLVNPFRGNVPIGIRVEYLYSPERGFDLIRLHLPTLERICKLAGGDVIEFETGRKGWFGKPYGNLRQLGFEVYEHKFRKELRWD